MHVHTIYCDLTNPYGHAFLNTQPDSRHDKGEAAPTAWEFYLTSQCIDLKTDAMTAWTEALIDSYARRGCNAAERKAASDFKKRPKVTPPLGRPTALRADRRRDLTRLTCLAHKPAAMPINSIASLMGAWPSMAWMAGSSLDPDEISYPVMREDSNRSLCEWRLCAKSRR